MKKIIVPLLLVFAFITNCFANIPAQVLTIYISNNTPFTLYIDSSNYNVTYTRFITHIVKPNALIVPVATVPYQDSFNVSFYTRLGQGVNYNNIPLTTLTFDEGNINFTNTPGNNIYVANSAKYFINTDEMGRMGKNTYLLAIQPQ